MNNKQLYITIFTIFLTQNIHAIQIDPLQIQSSLGEVLYAEMMVHTDSHHLIEASIATEDDLKEFAIEHHPPPHLNIYIRQNHSSGGGVITLTSTQPITRPELNLVIKIKAGNDIKLQHIQQNLIQKKPAIDHDANFLTPQQADEKFFSVDLPKPIPHDNPANNIDQQPSNIAEQKLAFSSQYPPVLNQPTPLNRNDDKRANSPSVVTPPQDLVAMTSPKARLMRSINVKSSPKTSVRQYRVKKNESLWQISAHIAAIEHRPIHQVMLEIEQHNPHAFIQGDRSKLKNHARLQIFYHRPNHHLKPQSSQKHRTHHQPTGPSKYRLTQAEMHIISDQDHTSENTLDHASPQKRQNFSDKIIQSRIKALQIQNEVIQLDKKLHQKAYKMQILNHRLAQLQRQLEHKKIGP